ncbi:MAG: tetratricopeptide repeat protein [Bacteroidota bacterium]
MKKILYILLVSFLLHHIGYAQKKEQALIDSLSTELKKANEDTSKVNLYAAVMNAHIYYKTAEGLVYQQPALALAQQLNWKPGIARIKDRTGRLNWRLGNYAAALKNHLEALDIYTQTGDAFREGFVLVEIGQDYLDDGHYADAEAWLKKAVTVSSKAGDKRNMAFAYDIMAYLYSVQGNISEETNARYLVLKLLEEIGDKRAISRASRALAVNALNLGNNTDALKYYKQSLQIDKETGDKLAETLNYEMIGDIYDREGKFEESLHFFTEALRLANQLNDKRLLGDVHSRMANVYRTHLNYNEALDHYLEAEAGYKSVGNKQDLVSLYAGMGIVYTHLGKYEAARKSFINAKLMNQGLESKVATIDYYSGIAFLDSATGNWKDAYLHYQQFITVRDSLFNKEALKKMVASQMQYKADKKEAVAKAIQEKKDLETRGEIKRQRNILYSAFAVIALVLLFSLVVFRQRNKIALEKKRSDKLLQDKELLLREIHHRVKNNLEVVSSLLALQSAQIDDAGTREAMQEGQNRVQSIGIVHQKLYQGTNLGAIEMKDYFINLSDSILDSFGAEGRVTVACAMEQLEVDIDTAVPLGLIVNELLTNTLKYAYPDGRKGHVTIKLEKPTPGILQLEVSDDGVGKSDVIRGTGFGGQLISLLTKQLGGTIKEVIDNGTRIFLEFKMEKPAIL